CIFIVSTFKYFQIEDCYLVGGWNAIHVRDAASGTAKIINNICEDGEIIVEYTDNCEIRGNELLGSGSYLDMFYLSNSTIKNNFFNASSYRALEGYNLDNCQIESNYFGLHVLVELDHLSNSTIRDNTFEDSNLALNCYYLINVTIIENNFVRNSIFALSIFYGINVTIFDNFFLQCGIGVELSYSFNASITANYFGENEQGILLSYFVENCSITDNIFMKDGIAVYDLYKVYFGNLKIENNLVNNKPIGFFTNEENLLIERNDYGQLILYNCNDTIIRNQVIQNTNTAINLHYCNRVQLTDNRLIGNIAGIQCYESSYISLFKNIGISNEYAIHMRDSYNNSVVENSFSDNNNGIRGYDSFNCSIKDNICNGNQWGILLIDCPRSLVQNNTCESNVLRSDSNSDAGGIQISDCSKSVIINNILQYNEAGIYLSYQRDGIVTENTCLNNIFGLIARRSDSNIFTYNLFERNQLYGMVLTEGSERNVIHHNAFIRNYLNGTSQAKDDGLNNRWYDNVTREGNYWSDRRRNDNYTIDGEANSIDFYPLKESPVATSDFNFVSSIILITSTLVIYSLRRKKNLSLN
ncbi:MAG: NosD domain-containing protein, partial [Candidatus Heimdallarchaeaceae archaeon]